VTSLSKSSHREVEGNREKWGDFWKKLMVINQNIVLPPDPSEISMPKFSK
jgi:hypothetical protein